MLPPFVGNPCTTLIQSVGALVPPVWSTALLAETTSGTAPAAPGTSWAKSVHVPPATVGLTTVACAQIRYAPGFEIFMLATCVPLSPLRLTGSTERETASEPA